MDGPAPRRCRPGVADGPCPDRARVTTLPLPRTRPEQHAAESRGTGPPRRPPCPTPACSPSFPPATCGAAYPPPRPDRAHVRAFGPPGIRRNRTGRRARRAPLDHPAKLLRHASTVPRACRKNTGHALLPDAGEPGAVPGAAAVRTDGTAAHRGASPRAGRARRARERVRCTAAPYPLPSHLGHRHRHRHRPSLGPRRAPAPAGARRTGQWPAPVSGRRSPPRPPTRPGVRACCHRPGPPPRHG